jgi:hypothetical protein
VLSAVSTGTTPATSHPRSEYFKALAANNLVPINVVDLTAATIPYWELWAKSPVATGIEEPFLTAYREGSFHYLLITAGAPGDARAPARRDRCRGPRHNNADKIAGIFSDRQLSGTYFAIYEVDVY